jgi:hypothetical protein
MEQFVPVFKETSSLRDVDGLYTCKRFGFAICNNERSSAAVFIKDAHKDRRFNYIRQLRLIREKGFSSRRIPG